MSDDHLVTDEDVCNAIQAELDEARATIAALREAVRLALVSDGLDAYGQTYRFCSKCGTHSYTGEAHAGSCPLALPIPPGAERLRRLDALVRDRGWWAGLASSRFVGTRAEFAERMLAAIEEACQ